MLQTENQTEVQTDALESAVLQELAQVDNCSPDELTFRLSDYPWDRVFTTVTQLARKGTVALIHPAPFLVFISLVRRRQSTPGDAGLHTNRAQYTDLLRR